MDKEKLISLSEMKDILLDFAGDENSPLTLDERFDLRKAAHIINEAIKKIPNK